MTRAFWRFLSGYVVVKVRGPNLERFLNRLARAGIGVWEAKRLSTGLLVASLDVQGFRRARTLCRAQGWRIAIAERKGLPFLLGRLARRKALVAGAALAACALYVASGFVWFVRVDADPKLPVEEILKVAASAGLKPGVRIDRIDRHEVQKALLLEIDELAWAAVNVQGTLARIEVAERTTFDDAASRIGDVVAARDGVVERVTVLVGEALVEEGDTVKAGQVLISGFIPPGDPRHRERLEQGEEPYVHADGVVTARVWYEGRGRVRLSDVEARRTGRSAWSLTLSWGEASWSWGSGPAGFGEYEQVKREWRFPVGSRVAAFAWERFHEVEIRRRAVDEGEAKGRALEAARAQLESRLPPGSVVVSGPHEEVEIVDGEDGPAAQARVWVEAVEEIARFRPL